MRSGRLLAEESPQVLLTMYGCQSLEEVFLKLSRKQGASNTGNLPTGNDIANNISLVGIRFLDIGLKPFLAEDLEGSFFFNYVVSKIMVFQG